MKVVLNSGHVVRYIRNPYAVLQSNEFNGPPDACTQHKEHHIVYAKRPSYRTAKNTVPSPTVAERQLKMCWGWTKEALTEKEHCSLRTKFLYLSPCCVGSKPSGTRAWSSIADDTQKATEPTFVRILLCFCLLPRPPSWAMLALSAQSASTSIADVYSYRILCSTLKSDSQLVRSLLHYIFNLQNISPELIICRCNILPIKWYVGNGVQTVAN